MKLTYTGTSILSERDFRAKPKYGEWIKRLTLGMFEGIVLVAIIVVFIGLGALLQ